MNRYEVNKVLWDVYRDRSVAEAFTAEPDTVLSGRELSADERAAVAARDVRRLIEGGAHPFLVYNFALRLAGRFSIPFAAGYVDELRGLSIGDTTT